MNFRTVSVCVLCLGLAIALVLLSGCTIKFKATDLELDSQASIEYELEEIALFESPNVVCPVKSKVYSIEGIGFKNGRRNYKRSAN